MKAILVRETGGPEKMLLEEVPVPIPGAGQALVRLAVSGVNGSGALYSPVRK